MGSVAGSITPNRLRIGYVYFEEYGTIALLAVYSKNDEADIPMAQRAAIKKGIENMLKWIAGGG